MHWYYASQQGRELVERYTSDGKSKFEKIELVEKRVSEVWRSSREKAWTGHDFQTALPDLLPTRQPDISRILCNFGGGSSRQMHGSSLPPGHCCVALVSQCEAQAENGGIGSWARPYQVEMVGVLARALLWSCRPEG